MKLIVLKNNVPHGEVSIDTSDSGEMYEIYVGRAEDCHVLIDDPLISRHHLVLKNENGQWYCEKLTQLGAVILNGSLVSKNIIQNGDEIKCGVYSLLISELTPVRVVHQEVTHAMAATASVEAPVYDETEVLPSQEVKETTVIDEPSEIAAAEGLDDQFENNLSDLDDAPTLGEAENSGLPDDESEMESLGDNTFGDDSLGEQGLESSESDFGGLEGEADFSAPIEGESDAFGMTTTEENESTRFFKAFVNYQLVLFGEHAPYDRYQIDQDEIFIGRDPKKCQIILNDPEVSSVHAVIRKNNAEIILEDLNSSNGTILNAERINKAQLTTGDEFVIGSTSFTLEVKSDLLESESGRLMPVESNQVIETEEVEEEEVSMDEASDLDFAGEAPVEKSIIKRIWKDPKKRKYVIYGGAAIAIYLVLFYEPEKDIPAPNTKPKEAKVAVDPNAKKKRELSAELQNRRNVAYELGVSFFEQSKYFEALKEFQTVAEIDPEYKKIQSYLEQTKIGLQRLEELEAQKRAEEERIKTKKMIEELLVKARKAVKERQVQLAESLFSQIVEKDPENIEVQQLRLELESWQKEQERLALEKAAKEASRKKMVDALTPGKTFYLKKEWYRAILKLEEFLRMKNMDEDLVKEASDMLSDSKNQLASELGPLLGKARSLKEGQDLKSAYEAFLEVLKIEPSNSEALNEVDNIKTLLDTRSKRIYREAIIAESLSLFNDAKEKFQEVQQISPTDSEYYKKATEKLKNYLE